MHDIEGSDEVGGSEIFEKRLCDLTVGFNAINDGIGRNLLLSGTTSSIRNVSKSLHDNIQLSQIGFQVLRLIGPFLF